MGSDWRTDFRLIIGVRLSLIFLTLLVLCWLLLRPSILWFSLTLVGLALAVQIASLFGALQKIYGQMENFFETLRTQDVINDPVPAFHQSQNLIRQWHDIQKNMRSLRERNEAMLRYHTVLLEKIPVPLLKIQGENLELLNSAARHLFQRNDLRHCIDLQLFGGHFAQTLKNLRTGDPQLVSFQSEQQTISLTASATVINTADGEFKIISLQPIQQALDRQQVEAWRQLVQVLSHEIMNSITPIHSLVDTTQTLLEDYQQEPDAELLADVNEALATVNRRARHLMDFVCAYRTVTQPLSLARQAHSIAALFADIHTLFRAEVNDKNISLQFSCSPDHLEITTDVVQLEHALINLIRNAIEALQDFSAATREIRVQAYINVQGKIVIDVMDNGPGIAADKREQVFVPFFTSKPAGTGIGLFFVQQVMHAHGGTVKYIPQPSGSCFRLVF